MWEQNTPEGEHRVTGGGGQVHWGGGFWGIKRQPVSKFSITLGGNFYENKKAELLHIKCFWFLTFLLSFYDTGQKAHWFVKSVQGWMQITILLTVECRVGINKVKLTTWVVPYRTCGNIISEDFIYNYSSLTEGGLKYFFCSSKVKKTN